METKLVEETMADVLCEETMADVLCEEIMVSSKNKAEKTIKAALIKAYHYGQKNERQTSQEREREIVEKAKIEGLNMALDEISIAFQEHNPARHGDTQDDVYERCRNFVGSKIVELIINPNKD